MSPEIYLAIESLVNLNRSKGIDKFLLLVKCDVDNAASTRLSLSSRFTEHVQFLALHYTDPTEDDAPSSRFKLKETLATYFLAYFFPGCDQEGSVLKLKMMRDEAMTNCIFAKTEERSRK
ncbi:Uncharacterized protein FKW44_003159 [Caligus rogercresseyi]|uniref:Uncharacterized protein n=1 Tax=Caligus rogercresseyi TaxID=217165 RepID=A0A7T8KLF7_CALRO|nr:Uncharacterized protein FKW44_003159 [Caligus rogercresseyi]